MTDCVVSNKPCSIHPLYPSPPPLVVALLVVIIVRLLGLVSLVRESVFCLPSSPRFLAVTTLLVVAIHHVSILQHCVSKCVAFCLAAAAVTTHCHIIVVTDRVTRDDGVVISGVFLAT